MLRGGFVENCLALWAGLMMTAGGLAGLAADAAEPADPTRSATAGSQGGGAGPAGSVKAIDLGEADAAKVRALEVVATGVGTDPQSAVQNALANAVGQAVGILVDAETIVRNDKIVRDEVLTYSRGFVENFKEITRWQENGLQCVRIRADVSATRLREKLETRHVALRAIEGDKIAIRIRFEESNEEQARLIFRKAVADFTPDKILTVALAEEKPAVERGPNGVRLTVSYRVAANLEAWKPIRARLVSLLERLSTGKRSGSYLGGQGFVFSGAQPKGNASLRVFNEMGPDGVTGNWEDYPVPVWVLAEVSAIQDRHNRYAVRLSLLDDRDRVIAKADHWFYFWRYCGTRKVVGNLVWPDASSLDVRTNPLIGPLMFDGSSRFRQVVDMSETFTLDTDEVAQVKKLAASIEKRDP